MKRDMNQNTMSGQKADIIIDKLAIGKINGMIYRDLMHECGGILLGNISSETSILMPSIRRFGPELTMR